VCLRPCTLESINVLQSRLLWVSMWSCIAGFLVNFTADGVMIPGQDEAAKAIRQSVRYALSWVWLAGAVIILIAVWRNFRKRNQQELERIDAYQDRRMKSSKAATENYGNKEVGVANHRTSTYGISKQPSSSNFFGGSASQDSPGSQVPLVPPSTTAAAAAAASPGLSAAGERLAQTPRKSMLTHAV